MMPSTGFEPVTPWVETRCSTPLSYEGGSRIWDSNPALLAYEASVLPAELIRHVSRGYSVLVVPRRYCVLTEHRPTQKLTQGVEP